MTAIICRWALREDESKGAEDIFIKKAAQHVFDQRAVLVFILLIVAFIGHTFYFNYLTDDAFITFRYVRNMLDGHGLVYNTGERVEGYTNFLWAMLVAGPAWLGADIVWTARILGLLSGVGTLLVLFFLAKHHVPKDFSETKKMLLLK